MAMDLLTELRQLTGTQVKDISRLDENVSNLESTVDNLLYIVKDGNGKRSLVQQVDHLTACVEDLEFNSRVVTPAVSEISILSQKVLTWEKNFWKSLKITGGSLTILIGSSAVAGKASVIALLKFLALLFP